METKTYIDLDNLQNYTSEMFNYITDEDQKHIVDIDETLSYDSTNPLQNKTIQTALDNKSDIGHIHDKSEVGLENVDNKSSATIRSEITKENIESALGYTPLDKAITYDNATTTQDGLMSSTDKVKLDNIDDGAQVNTITGIKGNAESTYRTGNINITPSNIGAISESEKGSKNGITPLNDNGMIDSKYLPSYVDDVLEYNSVSDFPTTGESGKIYVDTSVEENNTYRWSGTSYILIAKNTNTTYTLTKNDNTITLNGNDGSVNNVEVIDENTVISATQVNTTDSYGILVDKLGETTAQALIDEVANRVINLLARTESVEYSVDLLEDEVNGNTSDIINLSSKVSTNTSNISSLSTKATNNANNISSLSSKVTTNTNNISSLTTKCNSGTVNQAKYWNGITDDHGTENSTDTWIPVFSNMKLQHTLPNYIIRLAGIKPINFSYALGDPNYSLVGYRIGNIAVVSIYWVNAGPFSMSAWSSDVKITTMDVYAKTESGLLCVEPTSYHDTRIFFWVTGNSIYYRSKQAVSVSGNVWHWGGGVFAIN